MGNLIALLLWVTVPDACTNSALGRTCTEIEELDTDMRPGELAARAPAPQRPRPHASLYTSIGTGADWCRGCATWAREKIVLREKDGGAVVRCPRCKP